MTERWKAIKGYEGRYEVSSLGRVRSIFNGENILKPDTSKGYHRVTLFHNGNRYRKFIHVLVAETFLPNPTNKPCVHHIDENKDNNSLQNLVWCTHKENNNYGSRNKRISRKVSKPVLQLSKTGEILGIWQSMSIASKQLGVQLCEISMCTRNHHRSAGGYRWRYYNETN